MKTKDTSLPESTSKLDIENHPTFSRAIKIKSSAQDAWESWHMWDIIDSKIKNKERDYPTANHKQRFKDFFQSIYYQIKAQFWDIFRSDGTPYLYHLLETAYILLEEWEFEDCDIETIFIALLHDTIEDTFHNVNSLSIFLKQELDDVVFWVHIISKPWFREYIEDEREKKQYALYKEAIGEKNLDPSWNIIDESKVDTRVVIWYNWLKKKYKPIRNQSHFENYTTFERFARYAKNEAEKLGFPCSDNELREICIKAVNVKLADRLHNLRTLWHMSDMQVMRKIKETKDYILPIWSEVNPILTQKIRDEIDILERGLIQRFLTAECTCHKDSVHGILNPSH